MMGPGCPFARSILSLGKTASFCFLFLALPACTPQIAVTVKPDSGLTRARILRVFAEHGDPVGVKPKLESLLVANGFRVVTTPEEKADYVLRFRYVYLEGFRSFSAIIVDASSNEVVGIGEYNGYTLLVEGLLDEYVAKLAEQIR